MLHAVAAPRLSRAAAEDDRREARFSAASRRPAFADRTIAPALANQPASELAAAASPRHVFPRHVPRPRAEPSRVAPGARGALPERSLPRAAPEFSREAPRCVPLAGESRRGWVAPAIVPRGAAWQAAGLWASAVGRVARRDTVRERRTGPWSPTRPARKRKSSPLASCSRAVHPASQADPSRPVRWVLPRSVGGPPCALEAGLDQPAVPARRARRRRGRSRNRVPGSRPSRRHAARTERGRSWVHARRQGRGSCHGLGTRGRSGWARRSVRYR